MKSFAVAMLLGAVSSTNLSADSSIWDESTEAMQIRCNKRQDRWESDDNSWETYKKSILGKSQYTDYGFNADMDMMQDQTVARTRENRQMYEMYVNEFKRPQEIYPNEDVQLMGSKGEFAPTGIVQGLLGDCWFLAAAAAIAEIPTRMHEVVHLNSRQLYNPTGIFRYFFWVGEDWIPINIDDKLPVRYKYSNSKDYMQPYGVDKSQFGAWWMPLFEKAFAKLNGNYDRTVGGSGYESLRMLSGKPVFMIQHKEVLSLGTEFELFNRMALENHPMVLSCCTVPKGVDAPDGLQKQHAYTLLDVVTYQGTRLAKIRNPWSKEGYNGPWGDQDTRWTSSAKSQLGHTTGDDGIFFMPFENVFKPTYFRSTTVAMYNEFTTAKSYKISQKTEKLFLTFEVPSKQVVYFTLEGANPRQMDKCTNQPEDAWVNVNFYKGNEQNEYRSSSSLLYPQAYMGGSMYHTTIGEPDMELEAGTYGMMVANWGCGSGPCTLDYTLIVSQRGYGTVSVKY